MAGPSCSTSTTYGSPCDVSQRNLYGGLVAEWRRLNEWQLAVIRKENVSNPA
jgi:hypothetical protein